MMGEREKTIYRWVSFSEGICEAVTFPFFFNFGEVIFVGGQEINDTGQKKKGSSGHFVPSTKKRNFQEFWLK